jgi:hypothetical protein
MYENLLQACGHCAHNFTIVKIGQDGETCNQLLL